MTYVTKSAAVDSTLVATQSLKSGEVVDVQPYNANYADIDVNTFDSSVAVLPVSLAALGYTSKSKTGAIKYHVETESVYAPGLASSGSYVVDKTGSVSFDALKPSLWFSQNFSNDLGGVLLRDQTPGLSVNRTKVTSAKVLLLHLHSNVAYQAQTIAVNTKK